MAEINKENLFTVSNINILSQQGKSQVLKIQAGITSSCCNQKERIDKAQWAGDVRSASAVTIEMTKWDDLFKGTGECGIWLPLMF